MFTKTLTVHREPFLARWIDMSLVELARASWLRQMDELAEQICGEYKDAVEANLKHPGNSSHQASGSIHVEKMSDVTYRIGSNHDHLYFFEEGNGTGGIPKGGRKPIRPMPITNGAKGSPQGYAMHVSNYPGKHINRKVAAKYG